MKQLNNYISEKLHINKTSEVLSNDEKILVNAFEKFADADKKALKNWFIRSEGDKFNIYVTNFNLEKMFKVIDSKELKFENSKIHQVTFNSMMKEVDKNMPIDDKNDENEFDKRYQIYSNKQTNEKRFDMWGNNKSLLLNADFEILIVKK